jgi:hypothetical protein
LTNVTDFVVRIGQVLLHLSPIFKINDRETVMIIWAIVIASAIWVYFDAKNIGVRKNLVSGFWDLGPGGWSAVTLLLWIVGFPCYFIKRGSLKAAAAAETADAPSVDNSAATESDAIDRLEKLAGLRDRGVLTGAEFEQKKQELLAS